MKIYITTPGQSRDSFLSELGREQASRLGKHLCDLGFGGEIYSLSCTEVMKTAEIISGFTGSGIIPWVPEKMEKEDLITTIKRELKELNLQEDALFVVNEPELIAFRKIFASVSDGKRSCNCSLSYHDTENKIKPFTFNDTGFLAYKMLSYDSIIKADEDGKKVKKLTDNIEIPENIKNSKNTKILHITDTPSFSYPYYKKLIEEIRPDIIIHTGDFVDEVKVGRIKNTVGEYEAGAVIIGDILENSSAGEIYCVCGNNDVEAIIQKYIPRARFVKAGTVVEICGVKCALGHAHSEFNEDAQWRFYGHGTTGETWSADKNDIKFGKCRFNGVWNISVITLPDREIFTLPYEF